MKIHHIACEYIRPVVCLLGVQALTVNYVTYRARIKPRTLCLRITLYIFVIT